LSLWGRYWQLVRRPDVATRLAPRTPNHEATRPPALIIADTEAALGYVRSFHMERDRQRLRGGLTTANDDFGIQERLRLTIVQGTRAFELSSSAVTDT
jgi:hypothetical protein